MSLKDYISEDLADVETELGNPVFTWKGNDYGCIPSSNTFANSLEVGGFSEGLNINLTVRSNQFTGDMPESQDVITYVGTLYRVAMVMPDPTGASFKLTCVSANRGV